jgi:hypothetical protein
LALAPNNETYLINVIRFLGLIGDEGNRTDLALSTFTKHEDDAFQQAFAEIVKKAYKGLFEIYKDEAWTVPNNKLITFFRQTDQSSEAVGTRQASTFHSLAIFAGEVTETAPSPKPKAARKPSVTRTPKTIVQQNGNIASTSAIQGGLQPDGEPRVALTVRIEVNLPAGGDKDTYDNIFKSIRENLMNG